MFPAWTEKHGVTQKGGIIVLSDIRQFTLDLNAAVIIVKQVQTLHAVSPTAQVKRIHNVCVCVCVFIYIFTGIREHFLQRRVDRKTSRCHRINSEEYF